jgi:PadR family transcriptional regulator, regulatory protein AphA
MSSQAKLTPFSYAILALVGRGGAGAHDIVQMMREGSTFWTTSESHFYAEPKRLAKLGYLAARKEPGRTRERTHYTLTDQGSDALSAWLAEPAAPPRVQHEMLVKLLAADFSDDATILASLSDLRAWIADARARLDTLIERAEQLPHRTRYLRLINAYGSRSLDTLSDWLDDVEHELGESSRQRTPRQPRRALPRTPADHAT